MANKEFIGKIVQITKKLRNNIFIGLIIFVRIFLFEPYIVPSESMSRTMENGDVVIATKYNYGFSRMSIPFIGGMLPFWKNKIMAKTPQRGDVICFSIDKEPSKLYTKRIIGINGDKVQMKNGTIYINNEAMKIEYKEAYELIHDNGSKEDMSVFSVTLPSGKSYEILRRDPDNISDRNIASDNTEIFEVPNGHVFCMGDNMHFSQDFRFHNFVSSVSYDRIIGKPTLIIFGSSSRMAQENNWISWIIRLPFSIISMIINIKWSRIGRFI
ncbi:signal peptidase I [Candidatus Cytomitobacter indipagum]|uniref:Signal peptidase I n=1 Tax=Candidatus Cytomitobacter indipagum TaxID=2601575 RepID=A0A5C0UDJ6_9PROT|nr:signal peptidase I [Candidatus Cytomitobacter indipagum]QEK37821.1 signal peptidase I [Candidatus Cytomitobacter indipagum]